MSMRGFSSLLIIAVSVGVLTLGNTSQASAQWFFSSRLEPKDIIGIIHREGYRETSYPYFRGDIYVVDAVDPRGRNQRLILDPKSGEIVERLIIGRDQRLYPTGLGKEPLTGPNRNGDGKQSVDSRQAQLAKPKKAPTAPKQAGPETDAPEVSVQAPAAPAQAPQPKSAPAISAPIPTSAASSTVPAAPAPSSGERGTKENPRRVGPVMAPAAGAD
jgi:hypothetical protein